MIFNVYIKSIMWSPKYQNCEVPKKLPQNWPQNPIISWPHKFSTSSSCSQAILRSSLLQDGGQDYTRQSLQRLSLVQDPAQIRWKLEWESCNWSNLNYIRCKLISPTPAYPESIHCLSHIPWTPCCPCSLASASTLQSPQYPTNLHKPAFIPLWCYWH